MAKKKKSGSAKDSTKKDIADKKSTGKSTDAKSGARSGADGNSKSKSKAGSHTGKSSHASSRARAGGYGSNWFTRFGDSEDAIPLTDYASYTPGILMVVMIGLILILDLFSPTMANSQYYDFHNIFRVLDYVSIAVGLMFLGYKGIKKEIRFCRRDIFFAGFMICIVISTCINGLNHDAAFGLPVRYIGIFNMFAFFIIYMKVSGYIERINFRHHIMIGFMFVADAIALTALYDLYVSPIEPYQNKTGMSALFANSNHYGYFIGLAIMIGIGYFVYENGWKSIAGAVSGALNLFVLVLNDTLGAELAVGICIAGMVISILIWDRDDHIVLKKSLGLTGLFVLGIIGALIVSSSARSSVATLFTDVTSILNGTSDGSEGSGRLALWKTTVTYIKEKPLFGFGCEGITMRLLEDVGFGDAHCEPLTYAAYYGIPGMLLYLAGVITAAVTYFKNRTRLPSYCRIAFLGASAYFLSSLVGVPMFYTAPFFYIFMGLSAIE